MFLYKILKNIMLINCFVMFLMKISVFYFYRTVKKFIGTYRIPLQDFSHWRAWHWKDFHNQTLCTSVFFATLSGHHRGGFRIKSP